MIVTFIIRNVTIQGSTLQAFTQLKNNLKSMQNGGELTLIEENIAQINILQNHVTFANLVQYCQTNHLSYKFSIVEDAPTYTGYDSGLD